MSVGNFTMLLNTAIEEHNLNGIGELLVATGWDSWGGERGSNVVRVKLTTCWRFIAVVSAVVDAITEPREMNTVVWRRTLDVHMTSDTQCWERFDIKWFETESWFEVVFWIVILILNHFVAIDFDSHFNSHFVKYYVNN